MAKQDLDGPEITSAHPEGGKRVATKERMAIVDRTNGEIQAPQNAIRQVQRAVGKDIDLAGFEEPEAGGLVVEPVDFVELLGQPPSSSPCATVACLK